MKDQFWDEQQGRAFLNNPDNVLFLALEHDQGICFLTAHRLQRLDLRKVEVLLYELGVDKKHRQKV